MDVYFDDIEVHIISAISKAKERLLIAMAWLTSNRISDILVQLNKKDIDIEILVDDNEINRKSLNLKKLKKEGIDISYIKDLSKNSHIMHNKFCVVDSKLFMTGSYNWTKKAIDNNENIVIIKDKELANLYSLEFRKIKRNDLMSKQIDFLSTEINEIEKLLIKDIKAILSEGVANNELKNNAIIELNNSKVNSLIRKTLELTTINTKDMVSKLFIYEDLIREHGIFYENYVTPDELAMHKDKFKKDGIKDFETHVEISLIQFKIRAIKNILSSYNRLIIREHNNEKNLIRIMKIFMYLNKEKLRLFEKLKLLH